MAKARNESPASDKSPSQMAMVKGVLDELGMDAKPLALQGRIREKYGKDLAITIVSNYKSVIKRKAGVGRVRKGGGDGIRIDDLDAVRGLVGRLGAEQVRQLIDVFDR